MPNWCNNVLNIRHNDPALMDRLIAAYAKGGMFNEFFPCPEELVNTTAPCRDADHAAKMIEKYGYPDWYEWCYANWGLKWDIGHDVDEDDLDADLEPTRLEFSSAWCPPIAGYAKLKTLGFVIDAYYYESGCGFCGRWNDGDDKSYDLFGDSTRIRKTIPSEIDEMFGISYNLEQWEIADRKEARAQAPNCKWYRKINTLVRKAV